MAASDEHERPHRQMNNAPGNQSRSTRSELVIGVDSSLPWNVPMRGLPPPEQDIRIGTRQSMVFPLASPTTFSPALPRAAPGFFVRAGR